MTIIIILLLGSYPDVFKLEACALSVQEEIDCIAQKWSLKPSPKWNTLLPEKKVSLEYLDQLDINASFSF